MLSTVYLKGLPLRAANVVLASVVVFLLTVTATSRAQAQSYSVVYSFQCGPDDGVGPSGDLIADSAGNLYGTTEAGGSSGDGTVFEVSSTGTETVLYSFAGSSADGARPFGSLVRDAAGNLYGTTISGGRYGLGIVFEISVTNVETVLHDFTGRKDEGYPGKNLLLDSNGNLYGTTQGLGADGTVFKLTPTGQITELHTFTGFPGDGENPMAGVIPGSASNLYGTTFGGGADGNLGTVFKVSKNLTETVVHSFSGGSDGQGPAGDLVQDAAGNLYGTTSGGGGAPQNPCDGVGIEGCGTVFKLAPDGQESVLYSFTGGTDGGVPDSGLLIDPKGNLYGTASAGGSSSCGFLCGVVFEVTATGREKLLHTFSGYPNDGAMPYGGLLRLGNYLYGTTAGGGTYQCGTVYRITP